MESKNYRPSDVNTIESRIFLSKKTDLLFVFLGKFFIV